MYGVSGENTTEIAARIDTATALGPHQVTVLGGVNDFFDGFTTATTKANLTAMYDAIETAGAQPIAIKILPFGNASFWDAANEAKRLEINAWIDAQGHETVDLESVVGDSTDPDQPVLAAAYDSGDGLHPNAAGYTAMADAVWAQAFASTTRYRR